MSRIEEFEIPLSGGFYLAVEIESFSGQITAFVVRLMKIADPDVNIARFDTAHHVPHRDVLGRKKGLEQGLAGGNDAQGGLAIRDSRFKDQL